MNPFTLSGPAFLEFYIVLAAVVAAAVALGRWRLGATGLPAKRLTDPYAIALVRGGRTEAIRIGVMSLVRRGLLTSSGRTLQTVAGAEQHVRDVAEKALLEGCASLTTGHDLLTSWRVAKGFQVREVQLEEAGLIPDEALRSTHRWLAAGGFVVLCGTGLLKIFIALTSGHSNIEFLTILMAAAVALMGWWFLTPPTVTPRGRALVAELRALFGSLRNHAVAGRQDEALFLAAIYGAAALPMPDQGVMRRAFEPPPQDMSTSNSCGSSSSGSSCGTSSSCSSGSSCGGGGCGGCGS